MAQFDAAWVEATTARQKAEDEAWQKIEYGLWSPPDSIAWHPVETLRRFRLTVRLSQSDVAARCGLTQSGVARALESRDPRWSTVLRIADALECGAVMRLQPRRPIEKIIGSGQPWWRGKLR
jgi:hypothetical protein